MEKVLVEEITLSNLLERFRRKNEKLIVDKTINKELR